MADTNRKATSLFGVDKIIIIVVGKILDLFRIHYNIHLLTQTVTSYPHFSILSTCIPTSIFDDVIIHPENLI